MHRTDEGLVKPGLVVCSSPDLGTCRRGGSPIDQPFCHLLGTTVVRPLLRFVLDSAVQVGSGALCLVGLSRHHELVCGDWTVPSPGRDT